MAASSDSGKETGGNGCLIMLVILVISLIVGAAMSLAAIVDPFAWLPTVSELWSECEGDRCELADRFPDYWERTAVTLVYDLAAMTAVALLVLCARADRRERAVRYRGAEEWARWRRTRRDLLKAAGFVAALGAVPVIVAIA